ncbi:purine-nucleoside phosphorylase [Irregularibacter muris]|uniref:Purine nucleoside phosphorylase n=1 Tax=Irregularibacter muris TaxID=1796619 RepID=A0AAE3HD06_9FIRM|nr:purine-nucleoside phosphorylase [Irregularibacter muris]MCR1898041.1 purine-nucleoside phosphorylase [Irregularibacter muris]
MDLSRKIKETTDFIKKKTKIAPQLGLVLGSGLGEMAEELEDRTVIPYSEIPHFPVSTVSGHAGNLILGKLMGKSIVAMQGRFHYYEGYSLDEVIFPIRVMNKLGIKILVVTNAAGGVNKQLQPGDLMIIEDMINLQGNNPLIGENLEEFGPRFPDMSTAFNQNLRNVLRKSGEKIGVELQEGVYAAMTGPSYETPAEVRMLRKLGVDAVGMSTVPEVIVARHASVDVLGISCISNMAAGILEQPLSHKEVIETTDKVKDNFKSLIRKFLQEL